MIFDRFASREEGFDFGHFFGGDCGEIAIGTGGRKQAGAAEVAPQRTIKGDPLAGFNCVFGFSFHTDQSGKASLTSPLANSRVVAPTLGMEITACPDAGAHCSLNAR